MAPADTTQTLRERILAADDIESEVVEVAARGWEGVKVEVRGMTARNRARMLRAFTDLEGKLDVEALYPALVIQCSHDPESGEPLFTDADESAILEKSGKAIEFLAQAAMRLSGMSPEAAKAEGKESSTTPSDASTSS